MSALSKRDVLSGPSVVKVPKAFKASCKKALEDPAPTTPPKRAKSSSSSQAWVQEVPGKMAVFEESETEEW